MSEAPIEHPLDYYARAYGDDMSYWNRTDEHPAELPIGEREKWHRDALNMEQAALAGMVGRQPDETDKRVFNAATGN